MKDPKELELIEDIEFEKAMQQGLTAALEESDKRLREAKNQLVSLRMKPIQVGS